jgi:aspartate racemase
MEETEGTYQRKKTLWGILGGMGPLSSAGFLATIYRLSLAKAGSEQEMSRIVLISDPDIPDRTEAIVKLGQMQPKQYEAVKNRLKELLEMLWTINVDRIVIPCITAHFFLPYLNLPAPIESRICSLISIACEALQADHGKYILLRTNGTRDARIFETHPSWNEISDRIISIDDADQELIHAEFLYKIKKENVTDEQLDILRHLLQKYDAHGFVAGCTEAHLHTGELLERKILVVDPLWIVAQTIANEPSPDRERVLGQVA